MLDPMEVVELARLYFSLSCLNLLGTGTFLPLQRLNRRPHRSHRPTRRVSLSCLSQVLELTSASSVSFGGVASLPAGFLDGSVGAMLSVGLGTAR